MTTVAFSLPTWAWTGLLILGTLHLLIAFADLCATAHERRKR
jgi:hypothetical protein